MRLGRKTSEATLRDYKQRVTRVLVYIEQHLDEAPRLEELARIACFSPYHFHRIFKGMIGESLHGHIRRLRLERAAVRLKLGTAAVTGIALDAGYETHEAFTRAFKAAYGVAPIHFRSRNKRVSVVPAPSGVHYRDDRPLQHFRITRAGASNMNVRIQDPPPRRVAFLRHIGPYNEVGVTWDRLLLLLGKEGLIGGDSLFIGLCHDDPEITPPEKVRYDACVSVDERFAPDGDLGVQIIPGGAYAVTTHLGPYEKLGHTYAKLFGQWLPRSGRDLRSSLCLESYLNSPENTERDDLLTDIYMPLL